MATISSMLKKVESARDGIASETADIIERLSERIIDLNRRKQLFEGENTKGEIIGRYSAATEWITTNNALLGKGGEIKKEGDPYNFRDTGSLFKLFDLDFYDGKLEIYSTDSKVPLLKDKYENGAGKLFGLTIEHEQELNYEILYPELLKFIKQIIYNR